MPPIASRELIVTIDGPAGSGKSSVGRAVAQRLSGVFLSSGQLYRWLGWLTITWPDRSLTWHVHDFLPYVQDHIIEFRFQGRQPDPELSSPEVAHAASIVAADAEVRQRLLAVQRSIDSRPLVAEGRDMGTVVFPAAPHKFFLTASARIRARRRATELGLHTPEDLQKIETEIVARDQRDEQRKTSPLLAAADAIKIDTDNLQLDQVVSTMLQCMVS